MATKKVRNEFLIKEAEIRKVFNKNHDEIKSLMDDENVKRYLELTDKNLTLAAEIRKYQEKAKQFTFENCIHVMILYFFDYAPGMYDTIETYGVKCINDCAIQLSSDMNLICIDEKTHLYKITFDDMSYTTYLIDVHKLGSDVTQKIDEIKKDFHKLIKAGISVEDSVILLFNKYDNKSKK